MSDPDFLACEITRTRDERRHTRRRLRGWLGLALVLTLAASMASARESWLLSLTLWFWSAVALWCVAVCGRAAEDDADLIEWMGGRP